MAEAVLRIRRGALIALVMLTLGIVFNLPRAEAQQEGNPPTRGDVVVDVRVDGNQAVSLQRIAPFISTRAGRNYDPEVIEDDVRKLTKSRLFVSVTTSYLRTPEGVVVLFQLVERPTLRYVKYVGATMTRKTLEKQSGIKVGDAIDPYLVDEARRKLEDYYHSKGYAKVRIDVTEGNKPGDRGAVFMIHEGPKQKIWDIEFEGNTIADDGRLKTQIASRKPILYLFKGEVDDEKINSDVEKLTDYYRSLGYFSARVSRELDFDEDGDWATLRFVIDEGPRYRVRNVSVIGNKRFSAEELETALQLKGGLYFDRTSMQTDVSDVQDKYGALGYVYCNVVPDPRFLETPGEMDLIYKIEEGARYRVARVEVHIEGDDPHTRINTVLNRVELRPGDIVDIRKIRDSERRLAASGLFQTNPAQGEPPKITFYTPEDEAMMASRPESQPGDGYRGQSPDNWSPAEEPAQPLVVRLYERMMPGVPTEAALPLVHAAPMPEEFAPAQSAPHGSYGPPQFVMPQQQFAPPQQSRPQQHFTPPQHLAPVEQRSPSEGLAPIETTTVRFQSPWQPSASGYSGADGQNYGQVSLGSTAPGSNAKPAGGFGSGPNYYVEQAQYAPNAAPVYTSPPAPTAAPYNGFAAPNYGPPATPQPTPSPFMGNAPGVGAPPVGVAPGYGSGNDLFGQPAPQYEEPTQPLVIVPTVTEAQTGRFMMGIGVNSNAGLLGSIILDEQNADLTRLPTSWRDFIDGRAFRGAGQQFRIEAVPGTQVSRYSFIFRQPYLFDTRIQFGLSAYYFQRYYRDWREERLGGRISLGYNFPYVPDLSINTALRLENVDLDQPTVPTPPQLASALGSSALYVWENALVHDTRDNTFLATEGHRIMFGFDQAFGDYSFSRGTFEARQHFLIGQRPDRSGRQVLTLMTQLGISGTDTPIFENYFAGGFSSMRGFNYRGVGPYVGSVNVGGRFQWLNTAEYMFPISADDMIRGVVFCDFGTVEQNVAIHGDQFRVAPGFGLRLTIPAMGPAPIALDFAVPVIHGHNDNLQNFAFYVGFGR